ncbi:hypothetical protein M404DRAFT_22029 [Pisolithus tinctorius Marx 270]|uniref:Chromo domain-containing protein n=1 Tax=Pisolithus tinctorius Marx 270 TaxID=870435 RepID=A0A0C3PLD6_PISTI|nr:hypothetical protein M404DRAFT_22029 [Pisolithus tinctorius Marx 270]
MREYGLAQPPPPPELVGDKNKWEVEAILKHKHVHKIKSSSKGASATLQQKYLYLVKWLSYPHSQNSWESEENLINAPEVLREYSSDYFDNDFHANIDEPYDPSRPYFDCYASTPPHLSEPPVCPRGTLCSPSPMVSTHSSRTGVYQPLHDSIASASCPYPYPVIRLVPASQRACKDTHKGKSPSPLPHAGPSYAAPSVAPADLSAPAVTPAAPSTTKWVAPEASIFLSYMRLLNDFECWESHSWRAGECYEHLRVLSKIFRSSEVIGKRMHDQVATAEASFEAHTYEDINKANSAILQETLKTQEAIVKIVHEDYGPSLISSFCAFLDQTPLNVVVHGLLPPMHQATSGRSSLPLDPHREEAWKVAGEETSVSQSVECW